MNERIAIIDGVRTPMAKAGGLLKDIPADDLGAAVVREIVQRTGIDGNEVDEIVIGNVAQPANAMNIGRVIGLKAGLPEKVPGATVHRNCASGMEAISVGAAKLLTGEANVVVAGGTESMSNIPLLYSPQMKEWFEALSRAKGMAEKMRVLLAFRPRYLKPVIGVVEGLTDPVCGLIMGLTAENLARDFHITREEQDYYALESHRRTVEAQKSGRLAEEMLPLPLPPKYKTVMDKDQGPRENQTFEALQKLKPFFDRKNGTVTVGNSCPITDGAAAVVLMRESTAKERGLKPLGYVRDYAYAGLDPSRMGLGPVFATAKVLERTGLTMKDIQLIEMNEAFAAQIIANERAFASVEFARTRLGRDKALGDIDRSILNVNGGAIALGHPVGMTGTRIVITLLKELQRRKQTRGLATLCVGGGQGAAFILETE